MPHLTAFERLGFDESDRAVVYYAGLLSWVGCHVDAYEQAKWFGDDISFKSSAYLDGGELGFLFENFGAALQVVLSDERFEDALEAIGDFADIKSPFTIGHSRSVANLAAQAGRFFGLPEDEVIALRRAGLVHDFGRLGVSNAIWDKKGTLTQAEMERVRLHPYLTERCSLSLRRWRGWERSRFSMPSGWTDPDIREAVPAMR